MLVYATPSSSNSSTAIDTSPATQYNLSSSSSMTLTAIVLVVIFFFIGLSSIFTHRFFSGIQNSRLVADHQPPSTPLSRRRYYLSPSLNIYGASGLDPATIRALPVLTYIRGGSPSGCVVCLVEFEERDRVKLIPSCGHVFHPDCIHRWLLLHRSCPVCRCTVSTEVVGGGMGEFRVHLGALAQGEREGLVGPLGRSKSFDGSKGEPFMQLGRSCSV